LYVDEAEDLVGEFDRTAQRFRLIGHGAMVARPDRRNAALRGRGRSLRRTRSPLPRDRFEAMLRG
jgi:hypothetical protein